MEPISVCNSYDNTQELLEKFPIINPTPVTSQMEKSIQNRLLTGFENWNRGFEAWKAWGDILYTPDSLYNVHAVHLTLGEYQNAMKATLRANNILMGDFLNMVICGDWCAIHYIIATINRETGVNTPGSVMEFVNFKDYGEALGTRVVEGWAGTKGKDYAGLAYFQTPEERIAQKAFMDGVAATELPLADNLEEKYPVCHPTPIRSDWGQEIKTAILTDFECWNQGAAAWCEWADRFYSPDTAWHTDKECLDLAGLKAKALAEEKQTQTTRVFFDSLLISGDWAAIHYRTVLTDRETGAKDAGSRMQFLRFAQTPDGLRVTETWTK